jgi:hypothetical protein
MGIYLISFNLLRNDTYDDRFERVMAEIQVGPWWGETGSLMICEAPEPIDEFCARVLGPWNFDELSDIAVIFDLESGEARSLGRLRDYSLCSIVPWLKRL